MVKKRIPFVWTNFLWSNVVKMVDRLEGFASLTFIFEGKVDDENVDDGKEDADDGKEDAEEDNDSEEDYKDGSQPGLLGLGTVSVYRHGNGRLGLPSMVGLPPPSLLCPSSPPPPLYPSHPIISPPPVSPLVSSHVSPPPVPLPAPVSPPDPIPL